jgi:predicted nucleic acid-binding protein
MTAGSGYFIDTNILLRLTRPQDPNYSSIQSALRNITRNRGMLYYALQNIAGFWNVCTRPIDRNGFGLSPEEANTRVQSIEQMMTLLSEDADLYTVWRALVRDLKIRGVQVHDARLAALMQVHGFTQILPLNTADFARFQGISAVHPVAIP